MSILNIKVHDQKTSMIDIIKCDNQNFNQTLLHHIWWSTRLEHDNNCKNRDRNTVISKNLKNAKDFEENEIT